jgi:hypothetical protein
LRRGQAAQVPHPLQQFRRAIITKHDLAQAVVFDLAAIRSIIEGVRPGMQIFEVSSKMGAGLEIVVDFLRNQLAKFPSGQHRRRKTPPAYFHHTATNHANQTSSALRGLTTNLVRITLRGEPTANVCTM